MDVEIGRKYGAWTVIAEADEGKALCACACGRTEREVRKYDLLNAKSLMCRKCSVTLSKTTHGASPYGKASPEYTTWVHMIQRCHNTANKDYKNYGGRGITVCDLWRESFEAFYMMVGPRPFPKATIDRTDVNKGYEPGNCTWASRTQQNRNTRSNVRLEIRGESKVVSEWAMHPECTVSCFTIYKRLARRWTPEDAVFKPTQEAKRGRAMTTKKPCAQAMISAIFVATGGGYFGLEGVDPWDEKRDAMLYAGPHPVVAHPPCSRWCRLAGLVEARWGHKRGDDGGCFASALASVRAYGGVIEHPAFSAAWAAYGLPRPPTGGVGWVRGTCGGWSCYVEQGRYGHAAKKATWLYAEGCELPSLKWGHDPDQRSKALVSWCGNHTATGENRPRLGKKAASATPPEFRDILIAMARSARKEVK